MKPHPSKAPRILTAGDGKLIINNGAILQRGAGVIDGLGWGNHTADNAININVGGTLRTVGRVVLGAAGRAKVRRPRVFPEELSVSLRECSASRVNPSASSVNPYTGTTTINRGTPTLNRQTGSLNASSGLTFSNTGTFNMDNTGASGNLTQSLGALNFSAGEGTVQITRTAAFDQAITFASLTARTAGASGNFVSTGGTNSATNGFVFTSAPTALALIDKGIFYNGSSYATDDSGGFVRGYLVSDTNGLAAPAGATIGSPTSSSNVFVTGAISAQTAAIANTINMGANSITMSGTSLLQTNGILSSGSAAATLGGGTTPLLQAANSGGELAQNLP